MSDVLEFIESNSKFVTTKDMKAEQYLRSVDLRNRILGKDKVARESYSKKYGVDPEMYSNSQASTFVTLPDYLFTDDDSNDYIDDESTQTNTVLAGNLSEWWNKV
jgi:hypothetical protein